MTPQNASGHTPTDGPTRATSLGETAKNKRVVKRFYEAIFLKGQFNLMPSFFDGDRFIRHDPTAAMAFLPCAH